MTPALRISITLNVALLGIVVVWGWRGGGPGASHQSVAVSPPPGPAQARPLPSKHDVPDSKLPTRSEGSTLTPAAVAELERLGFSREAIVNAVINDCTYRHDKRVRALQKKHAPRPVPRREMIAVSRQEYVDRVRELKEALGEERYLAWDQENTLRMLNPAGLPMAPPEAGEVYRLQKEFDEKNRALEMAKEDGAIDEADANALFEKTRHELNAALETLLGPERFAAMHGAPDPVAEVSRRFEDLNPTPEQARTVLQAERDLQARELALLRRVQENPEQAGHLAGELKAMAADRNENLQRIFGWEAYETMKRKNDPSYQALQHNAEAWGLGDGDLRSVYTAVSAFHDEADLARMAAQFREAAGQQVDWREVNAGIDRLRDQTVAGLAGVVGDERVRRMIQNGVLASRDSEIKK